MKYLLSRRFEVGLVVVGLGVALYVLTPALLASKKKSSCQSNLKQIGLAAMQYVRDYDEEFMIAPKWKVQLISYAGVLPSNSQQIFSCPKTGRGYAFNAGLSGARVTLVQKPELLAMFYEPSPTVVADGGKNWVAGVHDGGSHVCFHDGHVELRASKPVFWVPELADKAGYKRRVDAQSQRDLEAYWKKYPGVKH